MYFRSRGGTGRLCLTLALLVLLLPSCSTTSQFANLEPDHQASVRRSNGAPEPVYSLGSTYLTHKHYGSLAALGECIKEHEEEHVRFLSVHFPNVCLKTPDGHVVWLSPGALAMSECLAYYVSSRCISRTLGLTHGLRHWEHGTQGYCDLRVTSMAMRDVYRGLTIKIPKRSWAVALPEGERP